MSSIKNRSNLIKWHDWFVATLLADFVTAVMFGTLNGISIYFAVFVATFIWLIYEDVRVEIEKIKDKS